MKFHIYLIIKTISAICLAATALFLVGPIFFLVKEPLIFDVYYEIIKIYINNYIVSLPILIGAILHIYLFIIKKIPPP